MSIGRQTWPWIGACLLALASPTASAGPRPPVESFFANPAFSAALLAPDARYLAIRVGSEGRHDVLAVVDVETMGFKVVANFSDADVGAFEWLNNDRLIFDSVDRGLGEGQRELAPGLYAVDRDGAHFRQLANRGGYYGMPSRDRLVLPRNTFMLHQRGAQNSEYVYVASPEYDRFGDIDSVDLLHLNTLTGRSKRIERPADTRGWVLDQNGTPRIAIAINGRGQKIWYRDPATAEWRKLAEFDLFRSGPGDFTPLAFGPDGSLYVSADGDGDKAALYRFDFAANKVGQPVVKVADYDFSGSLVTNQHKLLGVRVLSDAYADEWIDAGMKTLKARVDALLPGTVNQLSVGARAETPWVLVESYSDVQPRFTTLFNTATGQLKKVGGSYTGIDPAQMGRQEIVRYKARDGRTIPAWLTLPHDSARKNLPLVVLVHGGPFVRGGKWGWKSDSQFLASRGYAVLEPEYRGSAGFGLDHFRAGLKQWGLAMQDDIADGVRWAAAQGIADAKRVCIAGASYGGYAALMGLVNDPGLYKCGIDWLGVTDIKLMYTGHWSFTSDLSDTYKQYGMPELVGDPDKDAAQFKATSPLEQAARISQPLLLAYGRADHRVPLYHGEKFYEAVKRTNPDVEWVVYDDEGHGWQVPKNRYDFWSRVEKFLDKNIGKP